MGPAPVRTSDVSNRTARARRLALVNGESGPRVTADSGPAGPIPTAFGALPLSGGVANVGRVFRVGDTVRRPVAPCGPATHALLRHLETVEFAGAPRVLEVDGPTESLSWIPGRAAASPLPAWALSEETLISVAELVRSFHEATEAFDPAQRRWPIVVPERFRSGAISHNDLHPGNIIFAEGRAVGLIDFDLAGPGSRIWDLATTARCWSPLVDDADLPAGLATGRAERLALLLNAYGLTRPDRQAVVEALIDNHDWTYQVVTDAAGAGHRGFDDYWKSVANRTARARAWTLRHRRQLLLAVA